MKYPITRRGQKLEYPWEKLRRGDHFDIPERLLAPASARGAASNRARMHKGEAYETSQLYNENGEKITRIRRMK